MSREILFKGKRKNWRELLKDQWWVEGYIYKISEKLNPFIMWIDRHGESVEIGPETLCQYTGVPDKNSEGIWEHDILKSTASEDKRDWKLWKVVFVDGSFIFTPLAYVEKTRKKLKCEDEVLCKDNVELYGLERVGNIFDNPELLGRNGGTDE